jgi:hypothetical protein
MTCTVSSTLTPKIVQICCDEYRLYALTEDGEIWERSVSTWEKILPLPVEDDAQPTE